VENNLQKAIDHCEAADEFLIAEGIKHSEKLKDLDDIRKRLNTLVCKMISMTEKDEEQEK
jgi:hypothetical protein